MAKTQFKNKVEHQLKNGNAYCAWKGIKTMVGLSAKKKGMATSDKPESPRVREAISSGPSCPVALTSLVMKV